MNEPDNLFFGAVIYQYTRAQAIADGVLVDVSDMAREAGFVVPVALTSAVWGMVEAIPSRLQGLADVKGRLGDVLWMARCAVRANRSGSTEVRYTLTLPVQGERRSVVQLKAVSHPGDRGEHVVTIMLPDED